MVTDRNGEPLGLLLELEIVRELAFDLLIFCSVHQRPFNIWKFTLCLFRWALASIVQAEELLPSS
jgi:hypothetical protein